MGANEQPMPASKEDVTTLRKEGRLDEALALGRRNLQASPTDPRSRSDLGWVYYALLKLHLQQKNHDEATKIATDFDALGIPESDQLIHQRFSELRGQLTHPELQLLQQARAASKDGRSNEAMHILWQAYQIAPDSRGVRESLGWEIYRQIKDLLNKPDPPSYEIRKGLADYAKIALREPSHLHSCILRIASRAQEKLANYIGFVKWWDISNLLPDDFEPYHPPDATEPRPSLVENVIRALNRASKTHKNPEDFEWMVEFLKCHYLRYPEQEWFSYYLGKWMIRAGRIMEAREFILPIIRRKQTEFWAWDVLAEIVESHDSEQAIACLCRALLCRAEEKYLSNVRLHLTRLFLDKENYPAARCELDTVLRSKQEQEQHIPQSAIEMTHASWYESAQPASDNHDFYRSVSDRATELLLENVPWVNAIVMGYQPEKEGHSGRFFLGIRADKNMIELPVKERAFSILKGLNIGEPIQIKCEVDDRQPAVFAIKARPGQLWDILGELCDWVEGVVVSHQQDEHHKIIRSFVAVKKKSSITEITEFPVFPQQAPALQAMSPGSPIRIKRLEYNGRDYVSAIESRQACQWDIFPSQIGVIDRINQEKGVSHVVITQSQDCLIYHDRFPDLASYGIGAFLSIKIRTFRKSEQIRCDLLSAEPTKEFPSKDIFTEFQGVFRLPRRSKWDLDSEDDDSANADEDPIEKVRIQLQCTSVAQSFGFVSVTSMSRFPDVFVSPELVRDYQLVDGSVVKGYAIQSYNRKKNRWGWEAIRIL